MTLMISDGAVDDEQRKRPAEAAERLRRIRCENVAAGMVQCSSCHGWFYDTPGNYCMNCSS